MTLIIITSLLGSSFAQYGCGSLTGRELQTCQSLSQPKVEAIIPQVSSNCNNGVQMAGCEPRSQQASGGKQHTKGSDVCAQFCGGGARFTPGRLDVANCGCSGFRDRPIMEQESDALDLQQKSSSSASDDSKVESAPRTANTYEDKPSLNADAVNRKRAPAQPTFPSSVSATSTVAPTPTQKASKQSQSGTVSKQEGSEYFEETDAAEEHTSNLPGMDFEKAQDDEAAKSNPGYAQRAKTFFTGLGSRIKEAGEQAKEKAKQFTNNQSSN